MARDAVPSHCLPGCFMHVKIFSYGIGFEDTPVTLIVGIFPHLAFRVMGQNLA